MAGYNTKYYQCSPFKRASQARSATIFQPNEYKVSLLTSTLSAVALRALIVMASRVQLDGHVPMNWREIADVLQQDDYHVSHGISELVKYEIVARAKPKGYWLSPDYFMPTSISF